MNQADMEIPFERRNVEACRNRGSLKSAANRKNRESHHPATAEMNYTEEETEFMLAMDAYKRRTGNQFPTNCDTLRVLRSLGYAKVVEIADDIEYSVDMAEFGSAITEVQLGPEAFTLPEITPDMLAAMRRNAVNAGLDLSRILD